MSNLFMLALALLTGGAVGFIIGAFVAASKEAEEFDGGFRADNVPPLPEYQPRAVTRLRKDDIYWEI